MKVTKMRQPLFIQEDREHGAAQSKTGMTTGSKLQRTQDTTGCAKAIVYYIVASLNCTFVSCLQKKSKKAKKNASFS